MFLFLSLPSSLKINKHILGWRFFKCYRMGYIALFSQQNEPLSHYITQRELPNWELFFSNNNLPTVKAICFYIILLLFNYSCLHFPLTTPPTSPKPTSFPCFPPPPWFCPCVLYSNSWKPFFPLCPSPSPLVIVRLFLISMSGVIFCLLFSFVDYVPVKGETIWYLSLTAWLTSLSIMLSSSIHAVAKARSSFFLSAA